MEGFEAKPLNYKIQEFEQRTKRKMTIHILSSKRKDCISFVEFLTGEKFPSYSNELLEKNIKKKVNLYSFMNYKIYAYPQVMMKAIKEKGELDFKNLHSQENKESNFSEVVVVIDNENIKDQIDEISKELDDENNKIFYHDYYVPFTIIISPKDICLKNFKNKKTFQYKINLKDILDILKIDNGEHLVYQNELFRKLNILFSYYNELGDEFSFIGSNGKEIHIIVEEDKFSNNINVLFLGESQVGKSTILNNILEEMRSLEGGTGMSSTSKNILVYRKADIPLRLYDVKGIDNDESLNNYIKILLEFNGNFKKSNDSLNAIFYCIEYKVNGTSIKDREIKIFEKLIDFNIPILFIQTKTPFNIYEESDDRVIKREITKTKNDFENIIDTYLKKAFEKRNQIEKFDDFKKNYVNIYYINLVKGPVTNQVFGINQALSFFKKLVPQELWENLKESCKKMDVEKCKDLCAKNVYMKNYSQFDLIKQNNRKKAEQYIDDLKISAFFSGLIPIYDIYKEYSYRDEFLKKLESLYGFNSREASRISGHNYSIINESTSLLNEDIINENKNNEVIFNTKIKDKIEDEVNNGFRNTGSIIRAGVNVANIAVKSFNIIFLPITCGLSGWYSSHNIENDCKKMIEIFENAFTPLRFQTLYSYIKNIIKAIDYLDSIGNKIISDYK